MGLNYQGMLLVIGGEPYDMSVGEDGRPPVNSLAPGANTWEDAALLDEPFRNQGAGVDRQGQLVVYGGINWSFGPTGKGFRYDRTTGQGQGVAVKNHVAGFEAYAAAPDGRLFAFGGETGALGGETRYGWAEFFDVPIPDEPEGRWTEVAHMPAGYERSHAAAAYDGNGGILLIGGLNQFGNRMTSVLRYDLGGDAWTHAADLPRPMSDRSAALGPTSGSMPSAAGPTFPARSRPSWTSTTRSRTSGRLAPTC